MGMFNSKTICFSADVSGTTRGGKVKQLFTHTQKLIRIGS